MKKVIALILSALMIVTVLAACSGGEGDSKNTDPIVTGKGEYVAENLPDKTYDNYKLRSIAIEGSQHLFLNVDEPKKYNYEQYLAIERIKQRFGLGLEETYVASWEEASTKIKDYTTVGSDEADLNALIHREGFAIGMEGLLADFNTLPYCDPTQPWYVQYLNDAHTINGKCFFYYSYGCIDAYANGMAIAFNKRIIEDEGLESPYDLATNKEWTFEKFLEMAETATKDLDSDTYYDENDQIGIVQAGDMLYPTLWIGAGIRTIEEDEEGIPTYTAYNNEKLFDILEKCVDACIDGYILDTTIYDAANQRETALRFFTSGKALFRPTSMGDLANFAEMEDGYGMVPAPLLDDTQDKFSARVADAWTFMVPSTCTHLEETSVFLEQFAVESLNNVVDAYYKETLQDRYSDTETREWLDVIRNSVTLDLGDTIWQANCRNQILNIIWMQSTDFSSMLSSIKSSLTRIIAQYFE